MMLVVICELGGGEGECHPWKLFTAKKFLLNRKIVEKIAIFLKNFKLGEMPITSSEE